MADQGAGPARPHSGQPITCPLCDTGTALRADGVTIKKHTFSTQLVMGGARTWLCGVECTGGGMTLVAARQLVEESEERVAAEVTRLAAEQEPEP